MIATVVVYITSASWLWLHQVHAVDGVHCNNNDNSDSLPSVSRTQLKARHLAYLLSDTETDISNKDCPCFRSHIMTTALWCHSVRFCLNSLQCILRIERPSIHIRHTITDDRLLKNSFIHRRLNAGWRWVHQSQFLVTPVLDCTTVWTCISEHTQMPVWRQAMLVS